MSEPSVVEHSMRGGHCVCAVLTERHGTLMLSSSSSATLRLMLMITTLLYHSLVSDQAALLLCLCFSASAFLLLFLGQSVSVCLCVEQMNEYYAALHSKQRHQRQRNRRQLLRCWFQLLLMLSEFSPNHFSFWILIWVLLLLLLLMMTFEGVIFCHLFFFFHSRDHLFFVCTKMFFIFFVPF